MKNKTLLTLLLASISGVSMAHNIEVGKKLPAVDIPSYGEIVIDKDSTKYTFWNTKKLLGKVRVIQAIAGRSSSKELNAPLMSAITAAELPESDYQTTTIINQDDAIWGTGSFVKSSAESSKEEFPWSSLVLDENGNAAKAWDLQEESSAIIVQDKQGNVLFVKEGALTDSEVMNAIQLIKDNI